MRKISNQLLAQGKLVTLDKMLGDAWFDIDPAVAYPESSALACYLLEKYLTWRYRMYIRNLISGLAWNRDWIRIYLVCRQIGSVG